jgi:hypothetical protein
LREVGDFARGETQVHFTPLLLQSLGTGFNLGDWPGPLRSQAEVDSDLRTVKFNACDVKGEILNETCWIDGGAPRGRFS